MVFLIINITGFISWGSAQNIKIVLIGLFVKNFKNLTIENNEVFQIQKPEPYILKCTGEIGNYAMSVIFNALCSFILQIITLN